MSVVGFDIGTFKSSIGIAKQGGIEIVDNEFSDRITPTCVGFTNRLRSQGHSAKQQEITNFKNTISGFKRLLGRKFHDPQVNTEAQYQSLRVSAGHEDRLLYSVDYMDEVKTFTSEQIMAIFLTKLKAIAESHLTTKVTDCVISVPSFYTDAERRALLDATQIAGLNCLKLMNEPTAVALNYGLYNTNLPEATEKPQIVAFVDVGYSQTQVSVCAFNKGKLKMLATDYDSNLGGRDFDKVLMDYFQQDFKAKYNIDAYSNVRAKLRLRAECEKLKKVMSSNSSTIPLNIECFFDKDVSSKMKRDDFESLSESLLNRIKHLLVEVLKEAKLTAQDVNVVEIVGAQTRMPAIKAKIFEVFGKDPSTTLNSDEACARGCTLQCAILSPTFKVKEFKVEDCQLFPITLNWKGAETDDNELEVFQRWDKIPMSKLLTIYKKEAFEIEARYRFPNNIPFNDPRIGRFTISNVVPAKNGESSEVKVKARITKNGIFEISSPQLVEIIDAPEEEAMEAEKQPATPAAEDASPAPERRPSELPTEEMFPNVNTDPAAQKENAGEPESPQAAAPVTKKKKTKLVDLPIVVKVPQLTRDEINLSMEQEFTMIQQDRKEKERSEAKNSVEEYIYETRDKLSNEFERFVLPDDKGKLQRLLEDTESWLYTEEADDQEKSVYVEKLTKMKDLGEPIRKRFKEHEERAAFFEDLGKSIQQISKVIHLYDSKDEKYAHLEKAEVDKAAKCLEEKRRWYDEKASQCASLKLHENPTVLCANIKAEKEALDKLCWPILNRAKPRVDKPKEVPPQQNGEQQQQQQQGTNNAEQQQQQQKPAENMDID